MYHQVSQLQAIKAFSLMHKHQLWSWGSLGDFTRRQLCIKSIHQMASLAREMVTLCWEQPIDPNLGRKELKESGLWWIRIKLASSHQVWWKHFWGFDKSQFYCPCRCPAVDGWTPMKQLWLLWVRWLTNILESLQHKWPVSVDVPRNRLRLRRHC